MSNRVYLKDYVRPTYTIEHIDLAFDIFDDQVCTTATMQVQTTEPTVYLHQEQLTITDIRINGRVLSSNEYAHTQTHLILHDCPRQFELTIVVSLEPKANKSLAGLYASNDMLCTQCEAEGFRRIVPFLDQPDNLTKFTTRITASKQDFPILLAGGNVIERGDLLDGRHFVVYDDPFPKPSYLFALVAGQLVSHEDRFVTCSGRDVNLAIYTRPADKGKTDRAMRALIKAMQWDEMAYGCEYDLDTYNIVAVDDFNMGAMENKGLNIFNSKYVLADPMTATDADHENIDAIVGHEYFHNWTGNRVTVENWFYLSLKEGLTVFREQEFCQDITQSPVARIDQVRLLQSKQFQEDRGPMAHAVIPRYYEKIDNFYTLTIYEKGAEIIRMLKQLVGGKAFRQGMDYYFEKNDGKAVAMDDFLQAISQKSGHDLTHFKQWYAQSGTPTVCVNTKYREEDGVFDIMLEQINPPTPDQASKSPLYIPLSFALFDQKTGDEVTQSGTLILDQKNKACSITGIRNPAVLSINRGFSAPVEIRFMNQDAQQHLNLIRFDTDPYIRWNSANMIWQQELMNLIQGGGEGVVSQIFWDMLEFVLADEMPHSLKALMLTPPTLDHLFGQLTDIHIESIKKSYLHLYQTIADHFAKTLRLADEQLMGAVSDNAQDIDARRLQACAFFYLGYADQSHRDWVLSRYSNTENMTLRLAALRALSSDSQRCQMQNFYDNFAKSSPILRQKWWALQARSWRSGILDRVRSLMTQSDFDMTNPNAVFSLIGVYTSDNPLMFHSQSADNGYGFLHDVLLQIDAMNPQLSSRLGRAYHMAKLPMEQQVVLYGWVQKLLQNPLSGNLEEVLKVVQNPEKT